MKTLFIFSLSLLLINISTTAQQGWFQQSSGTSRGLYSVYFIDDEVGWVVGTSGTILHTNNGGTNWNSQSSGTTINLESVHFINNNTGWVVGRDGTILNTTDGGTSWNPQISGITVWLHSVYFIDNNTGWIVGRDGTILNTTDGGTSWNHQISGSTQDLKSVYFINDSTGWTVGDWILCKTTDRGENWISIPFQGGNTIFFVDNNIGWTVRGQGVNGTIFKTTDGGMNWNTQLENIGAFYSAYFTDLNNGWVVGMDGAIINTTDGGLNWNTQQFGVALNYLSVFFININTGWAVGEPGIIYKTTNGGVTFIEEEISELPKEYLLLQNYPNPFNPVTTISYQIPERGFVTLRVYDVLGNEIASLVNEEKPAGNYVFKFDATGLPSGIYFYRLQAGSFVETKKMVYLK